MDVDLSLVSSFVCHTDLFLYRSRYYIRCKKERLALKIQSFIRMTLARNNYKSFLRERLWWYRASRRLACNAQRIWHGFKARSQYRQLYEMNVLPDPTDIRNHEIWETNQSEARPPKKELGIYAEYTLSGTPQTWQDRAIKRRGVFYRDSTFYANTITKRATWEKPKGWKFKDHRGYYALRVQTFWRARMAKRKIR